VPGLLMPIGGAEDKLYSRTILTHFVNICGGNNANIVVIPSASSFPYEVMQKYHALFKNLGVHEVNNLHIPDRQTASESSNLKLLKDATGIFMTGGDQLRLMSLIGGTALGDAIRSQFTNGVHIGGTSAGASIMSRHMIAFGRSGAIPSQRMVQMASGLGLTDFIIDQHFTQRNRLGRLLTAVALNPGLTGIGIDEDTALLIAADGSQTVLGSGKVTLVDSQSLSYSDLYAARRHNPFTLQGVDVRVMTAIA
jgi:cyanophycinase